MIDDDENEDSGVVVAPVVEGRKGERHSDGLRERGTVREWRGIVRE